LAAIAFFDHVLAHFETLAKVLIDQRWKFLISFDELCTKPLIDHHTTSRDHHEANGLVEQVVIKFVQY